MKRGRNQREHDFDAKRHHVQRRQHAHKAKCGSPNKKSVFQRRVLRGIVESAVSICCGRRRSLKINVNEVDIAGNELRLSINEVAVPFEFALVDTALPVTDDDPFDNRIDVLAIVLLVNVDVMSHVVDLASTVSLNLHTSTRRQNDATFALFAHEKQFDSLTEFAMSHAVKRTDVLAKTSIGNSPTHLLPDRESTINGGAPICQGIVPER